MTLPNGNGATLTNLPISEGDCGFFRDEKISENEVIEDDGDDDGDSIFDERCFQTGGAILDDSPWDEGESLNFRIQNTSPGQRLEEGDTVEIAVSSSRKVSASATTISFVPGREDEFLFPDDSAFPDESQLFRTVDIPLIGDVRLRESAPKPDAFYGDGVRAETEGVEGGLSSSLDNALNQTKTVSEPQINEVSGEFKSRRISNTLSLTYTTDSEGDVDLSEEITVEVNVESPIDEVQSLPIRLVVTGEGLPDTIVHDEDYYIVLDESGTRFPDPSPVPIENFSDSQRKPPTTFDRHLHATIDQLKNPSGDVLNAVRLSTIWGAVNSYFEDILNNLDEFGEIFSIPNLGELLPVPPNPIVYTWIEVALLTDGTKYVRIPDASLFPRHELYVDGAKQRTSGFITSEDATDGGYSARYNEDKNNVWEEFKRESDTGTGFVPYRSPHSLYINQFEESDTPDSFPGHPVMVYGEDGQGTPIGGELDIDEILGEPLDPFSNAG